MHYFSVLFSLLSINLIIIIPTVIHAQQPYIGKGISHCSTNDNSTSAFGYFCNGLNKTCQSFLTFRSRSPYNTVSSISQLLNVHPSKLSKLNSAALNTTFDTDKLVLVPVTCSCSGQYYQANTSYVVVSGDNYFVIANTTFQGLTTCRAIKAQNPVLTVNIYSGMNFSIPLRCACPTKNQTNDGANYLLSFLIAKNQFVSRISIMFGVDTGRTLQANGLSEDSIIYPFTTLLVPLKNPPTVSQTIAPPPPPHSPPPPTSPSVSSRNSSSRRSWIYAVFGALGGGGLVLFIGFIGLFIFFLKTKKKADPNFTSERFEAIEKKSQEEEKEEVGIEPKELLENISSIAQSLKVYNFEELLSATDNFSPNCWIKGSVYRGTFKGDFAAIKKVDGDVSEEINVLNKISHFNLIRLLGLCFDQGHWYLMYEYAINGSLSDWIGNNVGEKFLSWNQRMQIASDVAAGLNYIHNYTSPPYVHKDVRSSNVLLDSDFRAKLSNFGLARSAEKGEFALTRHIVGTKGYMAPEYLENGLISTKLDIYAFGVLMLELLTGKEAALLYEEVNKQLSEVLSDLLDEENGMENLREFVDPSLKGDYPLELVVFVARLAQNCLNRDQSGRPGMDFILQSLSGIVNSSLDWEMSNSSSRYQSIS